LIATACTAGHQANQGSSPAGKSTQAPSQPSQTYDDTIRMLKAGIGSNDYTALGRLFTEGEKRNSDLVAACRSQDDQIAVPAFGVLHLLGNPACGECLDSVRAKLGKFAPPCVDDLTPADLKRMDQWWAKRLTGKGYRCEDEEGLFLDDNVLNEYLLRASANSKPPLIRLLAFESACEHMDYVTAQTLDNEQSLVAELIEAGQNLTLLPDLETSIRASAFFIAPKFRNSTRAESIARTDDRMLLEVSFVAGVRWGRGYYVVLRRNGNVWQYAMIWPAWIA